MPFNPEPYNVLVSFLIWLLVFGGSAVLIALVSLLVALAVQGSEGVRGVLRLIGDGFTELFSLSFRRIWALATLTFKESVRRKTLLVFVVFAILFMFAGWFMQGSSGERADLQIKQHVTFALRAISWLILPVSLLLACWGIPEDIKARSLHTVVTKPVRRSEVVLGRMLGFVGIGTVVVAAMGFVGYVWVVRQIPNDARAKLVSRVPVYGTLTFRDRVGTATDRGVNVGDMWMFRSFIEGASKARAVWTFEGLDVDELKRQGGLKLEAKFESFRTHKGDINTKLFCQYRLINPDSKLFADVPPFPVNEFSETITTVAPTIDVYNDTTQERKAVSLFDDLISNGKLTVEVQCIDTGQFLGMARPDLFIRMADRSFFSGFSKSVVSIWLMMVLVVALGVTASCFLKGPVATLATFSLIVVGMWFRSFMETVVLGGTFKGGGPVESIIRIATHKNIQEQIEEDAISQAITMVDYAARAMLWLAQHLVPNFEHFTRASQYAPNGFDVDWQAGMLPVIFVTLAYLVPCVLIGYYSLKLRELESK
ncbi:MAG: hypothetical protein WD648_10705 [Planctomycetaceae bacterium]